MKVRGNHVLSQSETFNRIHLLDLGEMYLLPLSFRIGHKLDSLSMVC